MGRYNLVNLVPNVLFAQIILKKFRRCGVQANAALVWKERIVPNVGSGTTWFYLGYHVAD